MRIAIIGAGPSGLVTLKYILQAHEYLRVEPIEVQVFEAEDAIGGTFRYRVYENAELVSSRQLTCFSDFRIPDNEPDFVSTDRYCSYLKEYCDKFALWKHIKLSTRVTSIRRREKGGHTVRFVEHGSVSEHEWPCDAVAICSGLHVTPNIARIPGIENITNVIHSSEFKTRDHFGVDQDVLICGAGETAMDLAHLAITSPTKSVTLAHRSGWQNAPKKGDLKKWETINAKLGPMPPTDTCSPSLFDTMYVHPVLERSSLLWDYYDAATKTAMWVISGSTAGLGQWAGGIPKERYHASRIIPNKSNKATPFISAPYRPKVLTKGQQKMREIISLPPVDLKGRHIDLAPWPSHIDGTGRVHFNDNGSPEAEGMKHVEYRPDLIILATGYDQAFPFLDKSYGTPEKANIRRIWRGGDESIGFIGFIRPNFGAIPPLAELQAQCWVAQICGRLPNALEEENGFYLRNREDRRIQYAVDHDSYAYQLAQDMSSAPSFVQVAVFGPKVLLAWALGPNFNTKFRLAGPWKSSEIAVEIMRTEWWHVICRRRGWFLWTTLTILPMVIFGTINVALYVAFGMLDAILWPWQVIHAIARSLLL